MSTTQIVKDIQSLAPTALIELFVLDYTNLKNPGTYHFHAGTNELSHDIVWGGITYQALPIEAEGFEISTKGTLPRPKMRIANMNGLFSAEVAANNDLVGAKVIRKRTFAKYLDAVNFPSGNTYADPNQSYPDDIWYVEQKLSENRYVIEWELVSAFDLQGVVLPRRQVVQSYCSWRYKGAECGYAGNLYFDSQDNAVGSAAQDVCGKRFTSCRARQAGFSGGVLPFGGFPGAITYD